MAIRFEDTPYAGLPGYTPANFSRDYEPQQFEDEKFIEEEISSLWLLRQQHVELVGTKRKVVRELDGNLGQLLYHAKLHLSKPGRSGGWSSWLNERKIHRTTADRLVRRFARSRGIELPHVAISEAKEPHEGQISVMACRAFRSVEKKLTTPMSRYLFIEVLVSKLGLSKESDETGTLVMRPDNAPAQERTPPVEPPMAVVEDEYEQVF